MTFNLLNFNKKYIIYIKLKTLSASQLWEKLICWIRFFNYQICLWRKCWTVFHSLNYLNSLFFFLKNYPVSMRLDSQDLVYLLAPILIQNLELQGHCHYTENSWGLGWVFHLPLVFILLPERKNVLVVNIFLKNGVSKLVLFNLSSYQHDTSSLIRVKLKSIYL